MSTYTASLTSPRLLPPQPQELLFFGSGARSSARYALELKLLHVSLIESSRTALPQIILRSEHFTPPVLGGHDREEYMKVCCLVCSPFASLVLTIAPFALPQLNSIKNLLGRPNQRFLLFGMLGRTAEGLLCLEDGDGRVVLDMDEAVRRQPTPSCEMLTQLTPPPPHRRHPVRVCSRKARSC